MYPPIISLDPLPQREPDDQVRQARQRLAAVGWSPWEESPEAVAGTGAEASGDDSELSS
ncbi:hypothetical protein [Streptacidiphilus cavernicola]|uniref:Uncharacterized protein n=1 Tax=Streptacidiphilus cavernicola TaxID=3342716 RepID=A0ABV6W1Y8_9ACTN